MERTLAIVLRVPRGFNALLIGERAAVAPDSGSAGDNDTLHPSALRPDTSADDSESMDSLHQLHLFDTAHEPTNDSLQSHRPGCFPASPATRSRPGPRKKSEEAAPPEVRPAWLYPGLSMEQHTLATQMLSCFYNYDWNGADKAGKKLSGWKKRRSFRP